MSTSTQANQDPSFQKLPTWFRQEIPNREKIDSMKEMFRKGRLHTVC